MTPLSEPDLRIVVGGNYAPPLPRPPGWVWAGLFGLTAAAAIKASNDAREALKKRNAR